MWRDNIAILMIYSRNLEKFQISIKKSDENHEIVSVWMFLLILVK